MAITLWLVGGKASFFGFAHSTTAAKKKNEQNSRNREPTKKKHSNYTGSS